MAFLVIEHDQVERYARPATMPEMPACLQHP
jgi:hypothetical protein